MEQQTGSNLGKEYLRAVCCHPSYLNYRQSTSVFPGGSASKEYIMQKEGLDESKPESRLPGELLTISICKWYHSDGRKRNTKRGEYKSWLKTQHSKTKDHGIWSHHGKYMGKKWKQWQTLFSWAPKSLWMVTAAMKLKDAYSLEGFPSGSDGKASVCIAGDPGSSLGWEDPLEKEMAAHSSILAWKIPWTVEPGRLPSMGSQRVGHDWVTSLYSLEEKLW